MNSKMLGLIGIATKAGKISAGSEIVTECIKFKKAKLVIIAEDASEKTKNNFKYLCEKNNIKIIIYETIDNLSKAIGKKNKAVLCVKDKNFADEMVKIYGGEAIG